MSDLRIRDGVRRLASGHTMTVAHRELRFHNGWIGYTVCLNDGDREWLASVFAPPAHPHPLKFGPARAALARRLAEKWRAEEQAGVDCPEVLHIGEVIDAVLGYRELSRADRLGPLGKLRCVECDYRALSVADLHAHRHLDHGIPQCPYVEVTDAGARRCMLSETHEDGHLLEERQ